jgi:hypothetical protein
MIETAGVDPLELLHFVETDEFRDDWERLGLDVDTDLWQLQTLIMSAPEAAPVIPGTGGIRKLRFSPADWQIGKSAAVRLCYAYFKRHGIVLLIMAYGKGRKETLTAREKQGLKTYLKQIQNWLDAQHHRKS